MEMSYELIPAVDHAEKLIRDAKDQPKCMTVAQFFESEGVEEES